MYGHEFLVGYAGRNGLKRPKTVELDVDVAGAVGPLSWRNCHFATSRGIHIQVGMTCVLDGAYLAGGGEIGQRYYEMTVA